MLENHEINAIVQQELTRLTTRYLLGTGTSPRDTKYLYIFDKDDTIVGELDGRPANTIEEQCLLPKVAEKCAMLKSKGHTLTVASNQGGVAYGFLTELQADALVSHAAELIGADAWKVCYHHPSGTGPDYAIDCNCRKPKPGMLRDLMRDFAFHPSHTIMVGDRESDRVAAMAAGVMFFWSWEFFGWPAPSGIKRRAGEQ